MQSYCKVASASWARSAKITKNRARGQGARTGLSGCYSLELKDITRLGLLILIRNCSACSWGRRNSGAM